MKMVLRHIVFNSCPSLYNAFFYWELISPDWDESLVEAAETHVANIWFGKLKKISQIFCLFFYLLFILWVGD